MDPEYRDSEKRTWSLTPRTWRDFAHDYWLHLVFLSGVSLAVGLIAGVFQ